MRYSMCTSQARFEAGSGNLAARRWRRGGGEGRRDGWLSRGACRKSASERISFDGGRAFAAALGAGHYIPASQRPGLDLVARRVNRYRLGVVGERVPVGDARLGGGSGR